MATMKNCFIQNNFNPNAHQLIFTWKDNQFYQKRCVADGNSIICMEKKMAALSQLKRSYFYRKTMLAFGIDQFILVLNFCL